MGRLTWVFTLLAIIVLGGAFWAIQQLGQNQDLSRQSPLLSPAAEVASPESKSEPITTASPNGSPVAGQKFSFITPKKSAHFETSTPAHGSVLPAGPTNVVIDFNFDLARPSTIAIKHNGQEYGAGETTIDKNKLTLRRAMDPASPDGLYSVAYQACWPDNSCHDGRFQFAVDRTLLNDFTDARAKKEVVVSLKNLAFKPMNLRISQGTKLIWQNDDTEEHYINTDSHPAHTYYPAQNSRALKQGESFSLVFDTPGVYPYHCSAHADVMSATIVVER